LDEAVYDYLNSQEDNQLRMAIEILKQKFKTPYKKAA
ncbi:MAG: hypothetical protein PWQ97_1380, partial [Tepidanaerobacteraceae bacterium]|nr:hypothetical protein [Tepidanaerobacteraceae bacterium]